jgi:hypothetical protein
MTTNTPSDKQTTAGRSAPVPAGAHVPRWTTAEQMEDWRRRIESEPLRVLAEVVDQADDIELRSRKNDGSPATLIRREAAPQPQVPPREETSEPAGRVVADAHNIELRSRKFTFPNRVLAELSGHTSLSLGATQWSQAISDFRLLRRERPEILAAMMEHRDLVRKLAVVNGYSQHRAKAAIWSLTSRVCPSHFADIYAGAVRPGNNKVADYVVALPDPMLPILADYFRRGGQAEDAFVHLCHGFEPHTGDKYLGRLYPSKMFPGIDPVLDRRLFDEDKHYDIAFCTRLAGLGPDQRPYMEAYFREGEEFAENLVRIPSWKRDLIDGSPESRAIWKLLRVIFTYYRWGPDQTNILAGRFMECRNPGRWATALVVYSGLLERAGLDVEAQRAATGDWKEPWDYPLKVKKPQKKKASS